MNEDTNMNNYQDILSNMDPEVLEAYNSMSDPDSPEFKQCLEFKDKYGWAGVSEVFRALKESPIDACIANLKSGSNTKEMRNRMIRLVATSEIYFACDKDQKPKAALIMGYGVIVTAFTRECHCQRFLDEHEIDYLTIMKFPLSELFLTLIPKTYFSLHLNPVPFDGIFSYDFHPDGVNMLYNLSIHSDNEIAKFWEETGTPPDQLRY